MTGRFAAWRVRPAHKLSAGKEPLAPCWLLVEWPEDDAQPAKYFFSNLPPNTSLKRLVATAKSRWWVEHSYRELKDELGLDHFEGRSWRGWNHHVVLVLKKYLAGWASSSGHSTRSQHGASGSFPADSL